LVVKQGRISQTALKVSLGMITLSVKDDWAEQLPPGLVEISERLLLASRSPGYGPGLMRASKKQWMVRLYEIQDRLMPGQWEGFGHRKIFMQQQVESAIEEGARQVLVLGAGFDTLCLRLAPQHSEVHFFEVDHPTTSAAKAKGVAVEGQPENMIQIAADLGERALSKVLSDDGRWDTSQSSVLLAEGLFQYLENEEVRSLLAESAACTTPGSQIVFTHKIPDERKVLQMILRVVGEPFRSAVRSEDLPDYIKGTGWTVISEVDTDPAHGIERYAVAERR
jgi:methyltransferase (TIGR00027 family)